MRFLPPYKTCRERRGLRGRRWRMSALTTTRVFLHDPLSPGHRVGHVLLIAAEETFDELLERVGSLLGEYTSRLFVRTNGCYYEVTSVDMLRSDDVIVSQLGAMEPDEGLAVETTNRDRTSTAIWGPKSSMDRGPPVPVSSRANSPSPEEEDLLGLEAQRLLARMEEVEAAANAESQRSGFDGDSEDDSDDDAIEKGHRIRTASGKPMRVDTGEPDVRFVRGLGQGDEATPANGTRPRPTSLDMSIGVLPSPGRAFSMSSPSPSSRSCTT